MEIYNSKNKIGKKGYGGISTINKGTKYEHREGTFIFDKGIVLIYDEPFLTSFSFLYKGIDYVRTISKKKKQYTDNGLVRMGAKFGREIVSDCS